MLNTWRGLVLAAGVAAIPAFAQAECPPPESLDRYAQTARDALVALDGLVPEEQQRGLEDRYTAMSVLRWDRQGRDAILNEQSALELLDACISTGRCDAEASERSGAGPRTIAPQPSATLVTWANVTLECETAVQEPELELEPEEIVLDQTDAEPAEEPETVEEIADLVPEQLPEPIESPAEDVTVEIDPEPIDLADSLDALSEALAATPVAESAEDLASVETPATEAIDPADTPDIEEVAPADAPPMAPTMPESKAQRLVRRAALAMKKGDLGTGVQFISEICFDLAEQADPAPLCETIFDHYDELAVRADPIAFLAFTDQLCRIDYARGCSSLATYFGVTSTAEAHAAAINFYDRACNSGDAEACAAASDYYLTGRASLPNLERARDTLYRACDLGLLESCQGLAEFFARGVGGDRDLERALELNEVSCPPARSDSAETCVAAANFVLINQQDSSERAVSVRMFTERACAIGHDTGCAWHADNLEFGIGGDVDMAGAERARQTACQFGHEASCDANS